MLPCVISGTMRLSGAWSDCEEEEVGRSFLSSSEAGAIVRTAPAMIEAASEAAVIGIPAFVYAALSTRAVLHVPRPYRRDFVVECHIALCSVSLSFRKF